MENLWPDFTNVPIVESPKKIIQEQAVLLGEKTDSLVIAQINNNISMGESGFKPFIYDFLLKGVVLNYYYKLFTFSHDIELYPTEFNFDRILYESAFPEEASIQAQIVAENKKEIASILKIVFASEKTKKVINSIISQSR